MFRNGPNAPLWWEAKCESGVYSTDGREIFDRVRQKAGVGLQEMPDYLCQRIGAAADTLSRLATGSQRISSIALSNTP